MDYDKMTQNIATEKAEKDRRSADALNKMSAEAEERKLAWNIEMEKAIADDKNHAAEMQKEIDEIQAEADRRIEQVRTRYRARYGDKKWNSTIDDSFRSFAGDLMKNR